jgi:uncharacterized protein (UPF0332 family)
MIDPHDIFELAEKLGSGTNVSEAALRSAASRAYYSIFHLVGHELGPADYYEPPSAHQKVRTVLLSEDPATCDDHIRLARRHFDTLKHAREKSDYRLQEVVEDWEVELWLLQAKEIFDARP